MNIVRDLSENITANVIFLRSAMFIILFIDVMGPHANDLVLAVDHSD